MSNSQIDEIKNRLDIVEVAKEYVKLQKSGVNYRALCPFHSEKTPSFFVSPSRQIWHCFGSCSRGGNIFSFIMEAEGVEFGDALRILAAKAGVELKRQDPRIKTERQRSYEICEWAARFFQKFLETESGKKAKEYLLGRGIKEESVEEWRLGYSPNSWDSLLNFLIDKGYRREEVEKAGLAIKKENSDRYYDRFRGRIIFPIFDFSSQPIGFGGRIFDSEKERQKEAKYLNTPNTMIYDKSKVLYGLHKARNDIRKENMSVLVEGYTDAIMSHQAGIKSAVATSGTALTSYQLAMLKRYSDNIVTAFDMDIAGGSATERGINMAQEKEFNIKVAIMPENLDPADLVAQDPEKWEKTVKLASSIISFYIQTAFSRFDSEIPENKKEIARIVLPVIKRIPSDIERDSWIQYLAKKLKVKESAVIEDLGKIKDDSSWNEDKKDASPKKKNRKLLLEERFLMILIKDRKKMNLLDCQDMPSLSQEACDIIESLKDEGKNSPELKEKIDYLSLKSDVDMDSIDIEEEMNSCLSELKMLDIKEKLDQISQKIKSAEEKKNNEEAENLKKEFNLCCKKLGDIN